MQPSPRRCNRHVLRWRRAVAEFVFLNDRLVPAEEATVSVFDAGFTHAAGLFETMRAYNGHVLRLEQHLDRLIRSAATLELQMPAAIEAQVPSSQNDLKTAILSVLEANKLRDARLRLVITPGDVPRPGQSLEHRPPPTVLITASPLQPYPGTYYRGGMRVTICPYKISRTDPLAGHKTLAYLPRLLAMKDAADRGCQESLWFTTENFLAEGSVCNVFIISGGTIMTPPADTPILPGITRAIVMELSREGGAAVEERKIDINMLLAAEEVFLTGSIMEIMPVTSIEKHMVGDGSVGPLTQKVMELFRSFINKECGTDG